MVQLSAWRKEPLVQGVACHSAAPLAERWLAQLRVVPLMKTLDEGAVSDLLTHAKVQWFDRGAMVTAPTASPEGIDIVLVGRLRLVHISPHGREYTPEEYGPGEIAGLEYLAASGTRPGYLQASASPTFVCNLPRLTLREAVLRSTDASGLVMRLLGERIQRGNAAAEEIATSTVAERVADLLARLSEVESSHIVWCTQDELAAQIGTSREEVNRALRVLREHELIVQRPHRRGVVVPDPDRLRAWSRHL